MTRRFLLRSPRWHHGLRLACFLAVVAAFLCTDVTSVSARNILDEPGGRVPGVGPPIPGDDDQPTFNPVSKRGDMIYLAEATDDGGGLRRDHALPDAFKLLKRSVTRGLKTVRAFLHLLP